jgi:hypothetical protein
MLRSLLLVSLLFTSFYGSSAIRFVRAVYNSNAASAFTVIWDQVSGDSPVFMYDTVYPTDFNFRFNAAISATNNGRGMHNTIVRLNGLKPNTRYYYCIKDSEGYSIVFHTSTVPNDPNQPLSFVAGGDSRDRRNIRVLANRMVAKLKPHAVLFNGDMIGIDIEKQWIEWFEDWEQTIDKTGRVPAIVVTRGNHELNNKGLAELFDVPHRKLYYSTEFGDSLLHIVSLNSEIHKFGNQRLFLRSALKRHEDYIWQIAQYHRPVRPHVSHKKEMNTQYRNFVPLFERHPNLKLCLENDSHTCKTTWPIVRDNGPGSEEGFIRNDSIGITYVGEGCWGAPLRQADDNKCWTRNSEAINQVNWIFVSREKIEVRTIKYENVDQVGELTEENRFSMPENIDLWNPSNGSVVEIKK